MSEAIVLLVTGARALTRSSLASAWAQALIHRWVERLPLGSGIITGDARGPDSWAIQAARARNAEREALYWSAFGLDGMVRRQNGDQSWVDNPRRDLAALRRQYPCWPHVRNAVMVSVAAEQREFGDHVIALALRAPWATSNGTGQTVGLCRAAGIEVFERVCPKEYAP